MQQGQVVRARSAPDTHFTGAIAQNAGETENITLPEAVAAGRTCRARITSIVILSVENLAWEVWLFGKDTFRTGAAGTESFLGLWEFDAADARRIGGAGLYAYYIDGLDVPYQDEDVTGELHIALVNRSAAAKSAGAAGAVSVQVVLEPTLGGG